MDIATLVREKSNTSEGDEFFDACEHADEFNSHEKEELGGKWRHENDSNEKVNNKHHSLCEHALVEDINSDHTQCLFQKEEGTFWESARSVQTEVVRSLSYESLSGSIQSSGHRTSLDVISSSSSDDVKGSLEDNPYSPTIRSSMAIMGVDPITGNERRDDGCFEVTMVCRSEYDENNIIQSDGVNKSLGCTTDSGGKITATKFRRMEISRPLPEINHDRPGTPLPLEQESDKNHTFCGASTEVCATEFCTPKQKNSKKPHVPIDERNLAKLLRCDVTSPLEALYLLCPLVDSDKEGTKQTHDTSDLNEHRTNMSHVTDADPVGEAPLSPGEQLGIEHDKHLDFESETSDDDSSVASSGQFQITNQDTGSIHDLRKVMQDIDEVGSSGALDTCYSFLPTRVELEHHRASSLEPVEPNQEVKLENLDVTFAFDSFNNPVNSQNSSPVSAGMKRENLSSSSKTNVKRRTAKLADFRNAMATNVRKGVEGLRSTHQHKLNRKRTISSDVIPRNSISVRRSARQNQNRVPNNATGASSKSSTLFKDIPIGSSTASSFNPMLLIKTVSRAHIGPAWCASFNLDGRFLATGGEDGNVCIWDVAPNSKNIHPGGIAAQPDKCGEKTESSESNGNNIDSLSSAGNSGKQKANKATGELLAPPLSTVGTGPELATNLQLLSSEPSRRYIDHTADVIDLSWSHTNFLLSASLDSSVRLYHFSKPGCLHLFKHANLVASVAFHPNDDRYFISGGIDKKLRLWSIPDGRVKEWAQAPDVITTARFTPDGKYAVAGLFRGQVYFYAVEGLKYYTQIACRNRSGKHRMGRKVTGISFVRGERDDWLKHVQDSPPSNKEDSSSDGHKSLQKLSDTGTRVARRVSLVLRGNGRPESLRYTERMLVSTNDSRVRLYGLNDFCLVRKYKGHTNYSMQIRTRVSESGNFIASGSESGHVFIWNTLDKNRPVNSVNMKVHQTQDKARSSHCFEASKAPLPIVTDSVFFPIRSMKEALVSSEAFPFSLGMDRVDDDLSSAALVTLDYDGTMRVFLRKSCIDALLEASTPRGGTMA